ncbi:MAG: hypothetical protein MMC23_004186 [Stictis urceolatum]|nr:hypothetical protein [Stictis urceolata]
MSGRPRPSSSLPKPPTTLAASAVVADNAVLTGSYRIILGSDVVIHPRAKLISAHCPIAVRAGCVISERAHVGLQEALQGDSEDEGEGYGIELGHNVVLEPAAIVEARTVGEGTVFEAGCKVGPGAVIGKFCRITPLCTVRPNEELPDFTIVYGNNQKRREKPGLEALRMKTHEKEIEVLRRLIPSSLAKWQT